MSTAASKVAEAAAREPLEDREELSRDAAAAPPAIRAAAPPLPLPTLMLRESSDADGSSSGVGTAAAAEAGPAGAAGVEGVEEEEAAAEALLSPAYCPRLRGAFFSGDWPGDLQHRVCVCAGQWAGQSRRIELHPRSLSQC